MEYKKQHVVSQAFLKAWADPRTPSGQEPYVWLISRDGINKEKRAPKSILFEKDFYTVIDKGGSRNVDLEKKLSQIEGKFIEIRDRKLLANLPLIDDEYADLVSFIAVSYARTKYNKDSQSQVWRDYREFLNAIKPGSAPADILDEVEELISQPMPFFVASFLDQVFNQLMVMSLTIHHTSVQPGFVTSDNPVIWFDPAVFIPELPMKLYGVGSPTLNIMMPISPNRVITLSHEYPKGYFPNENPQFVDALNSMMVGFCEEVFVSSTDEVLPQWLPTT